MRIHVTNKHIEEGVEGDPHFCPVAEALREYPTCQYTLVDASVFWNTDDGYDKLFYVKVPEEVTDFVETFDDEVTHPLADPFSFNMSAECFMK